MSKLAQLLIVKDEEKKAILKNFGDTEEVFNEKVQIVKQWVLKSPHLPHHLDDNVYRVFLLNSKLSIERTKQSLEGFLTVKSVYPELFEQLSTGTDLYKRIKKYVVTVVLPRLTPDLCRVTFYRLEDFEAECEDVIHYFVMVFMTAEFRMRHDFFNSNIFIIDNKHATFRHAVMFSIPFAQKIFTIMSAINLRIESIILLNVHPIVDQAYNVAKQFFPKKISERLHFCKDNESLAEFVPKECLPCDYGGQERSTNDLWEDWYNELKNHEQLFTEAVNYKSNISLKPTISYNSQLSDVGSEGSFKKLSID